MIDPGRTLSEAGETQNRIDRLLGHWLWVAAMILVAAALTIPQVDRLAFTPDEKRQYIQSFGPMLDSWSAGDTLALVRQQSPDQAPLSHLLLNLWGNAIGKSAAAARIPFVFAGLMSLAMVYRLARDQVSPAVGALAVFILLSHAMYAFYFAYVRYYTLVVFLAAAALWLYLRIVRRGGPPTWRMYLALAISCAALISTHMFGFVLYATVSLYHLLAAEKNRRWLQAAAAALGGLALASPLILPTYLDGASRAQGVHGSYAEGLDAILAQWLTVNGNGSIPLFAFIAAGALVGWRRNYPRVGKGNPFLPLLPLLAVGIALASAVTGVVSTGQMRYFLVGSPIVVTFLACGIWALRKLRRWLGLLALLMWLAAGLIFHQTADWQEVIQGRAWSYTRIPWHLLSRWMQQSGEELPVMTIGDNHGILDSDSLTPVSLSDYYFGQYGISVSPVSRKSPSPSQIADYAESNMYDKPSFRVVYQTLHHDPDWVAAVEAAAERMAVQLCDVTAFPNSTVVLTWRWEPLDCEPPAPRSAFETDIGGFAFFGAIHDPASGLLAISGAWQSAGDLDADDLNLSYQLLDDEWRNLAQLDLPIAHIEGLRRFNMDTAHVPPGEHRLMAVVYNAATGERQAWHDNDGWVPEMQELAEIEILGTIRNEP